MKPTAFIYSSHDRCEYIHKDWIIQRALESWDNKTILHLPMSQRDRGGQEWDYGNFRWYYSFFEKYGLKHYPFYWSDNLSRHDIDVFFDMLWNSQVVVLGGGNSELGLYRYKKLGEMYNNDPYLFGKICHERQKRGLLTVGYSAGADQLCEYLCTSVAYQHDDPYGFGLAKNIVATLHHEKGREGDIYQLATALPHCRAFGLPNDSGIGVDQGVLPSSNIWQIIWFVIDNSWDVPQDQWHIKTRAGEKIHHFYPDGRHWAFNGGDIMLRVMSPDYSWQQGAIITNQGQWYDYWTQQPMLCGSIEEYFSWF